MNLVIWVQVSGCLALLGERKETFLFGYPLCLETCASKLSDGYGLNLSNGLNPNGFTQTNRFQWELLLNV